MKLVSHFGVPAVIIINKADLNEEQAQRIEQMALKHGSRVIGRIPFDRAVNDSLMAGKTVVDFGDSAAKQAILEIWKELQITTKGTLK